MDHKDDLMGSIEITAIIKYLWAGLIPIAARWWSSVDKRFKDTEDKVDKLDDTLSDITATQKVLVERSENQETAIQRIENMLMKLLLKDKSD